ncbi:MAG: PSD1 domain-containing protein [Planctomycetaceae bacterium]|nr:PSD1 domain-containing protein [Planctomycetaceae bacterium]
MGFSRSWASYVSACVVCVLFAMSNCVAADEIARFADHVRPLLVSKCLSCHGRNKQEGQLRLDQKTHALAGGDRGPSIVPGDANGSLLIQAVKGSDPDFLMPPKQPLSADEVQLLTDWVNSGAAWPEDAVALFDDHPDFAAALRNGKGTARLSTDAPYSGVASLTMTPLQRDAKTIPGWNFEIREQPAEGQYRFLRLAWKKQGAGSIMLELARDGEWPEPNDARGRYVAGPNTTGWQAVSVSEQAPTEWTVVTVDLWKDIGEFTLTGCAPTCDQGEMAWFDMMILGPTVESLDAYRMIPASDSEKAGDAFADERNPIRRLFGGERLDLWSLKIPVKVPVPQEAAHPVDAFIQQAQSKVGIASSPKADRRTLIRRLTVDLTGLPPSAKDVDAFVQDESEQAYENLVDRLLASPRYGERQARYWLDVVRYADTHGYERDEYRPLIWQYRDYVIRSFNSDKPFDQFVKEQLAGDELVLGEPHTSDQADALIATGYLRLGQWDSTASIFQEEDRLRAEVQADLTNTTASAFLGLTMSCCQCHDHKYDPLSQADHYRMRAFFAGIKSHDDLVIDVPEVREEIEAHNGPLEEKIATLKAMRPKKPDSDEEKTQVEALDKEIAALEAQKKSPRVAMGVRDAGPVAEPTFVLYQGDFHSPREQVSPGFPSVLFPGSVIPESPSQETTGRRLALAEWITSEKNPWTARVLVNRIWQQHFGTGLVATPNDFGYTGTRPTHPELLDWLAIWLMENDWSVKKLHRLLVMSETYQQASVMADDSDAANAAKASSVDPENQLLWRQNIRRLDAETLRDSLLAVSGLLSSYDSGRPMWPAVPDDLLHAQPAILEALKNDDGGRMQGWYTDPVDQVDVRSLFVIRKRCLPVPFLQAFDLPDSTVSCARRDTTVVAPQALMLLNSPEGIRYADAFADRILAAAKSEDTQADQSHQQVIQAIFREALLRDADIEELRLSREMLADHLKRHRESGRSDDALRLAVRDLCRAILNVNEFMYVD